MIKKNAKMFTQNPLYIVMDIRTLPITNRIHYVIRFGLYSIPNIFSGQMYKNITKVVYN